MARPVDGARVRAAIEAAERRTGAEIVVAFAPFFLGRVGHAAQRAFVRLGVAGTRGRNGVLVFVVPRRRQVVVVPDREAEAQLDPQTWQRAVAAIVAGFAAGRATDGMIEAITGLGDALAGWFPPSADDRNELPDVTGAPA